MKHLDKSKWAALRLLTSTGVWCVHTGLRDQGLNFKPSGAYIPETFSDTVAISC